MKYVGFVFGGDVLRFFHGGDECLTIPGTWTRDPAQKYITDIQIYFGVSKIVTKCFILALSFMKAVR